MSLSILGMGGRTPTWQQRQQPQSQSGGGAGGGPAHGPGNAVEVATSGAAGEQERTEIAAINQAIQAAEQGLALVSTARHGLEAVQQRLTRMAAALISVQSDRGQTKGVPSPALPDPAAWAKALRVLQDEARAIDSLARDTRFGETRLLDGSCGCRGAAYGPWLEFVGARGRVRSSPPEGFPVVLQQEPTRAAILGERALSAELIAAGENLAVETESRWTEIRTGTGQSFADVVNALNDAIGRKKLPLAVLAASGDRLLVHHKNYGRGWRFCVRSSTPGILSGRRLAEPWGGAQEVANGRDVVGTINGEPAEGRQQLLIGLPDNRTTAGLAVRYTGTPPPGFEPAEMHPGTRGGKPAHASPRDGWKDGVLHAGRVLIVQRSLTLHAGDEDVVVRFDAVGCADLGRSSYDRGNVGGGNPSGGDLDSGELASVADAIHAEPWQATQALAVIERARVQVAQTLQAAELAERVTLAGYLAKLRVESANRLATGGMLGTPADVRACVAQLGLRLRTEGADVLLAQRYPRPTALLRLLNGTEEVDPK